MMIGDNRDASLDARFFGVVPEENIVGRPMFTWLSVEGLFSDAGSTYQAPGKKSVGTGCSKPPTQAKPTKHRIGG
jgi:signal peptidase I